MGFTDLIIKLSNSKFARKFQFEPYIIKSVEYINPSSDDKILVIYKETDYLQQLMTQYVKYENYFSFEIGETIDIEDSVDKIVLFFSMYDITDNHISLIKNRISKDGTVYAITYLNDSKFFELTLKLIDKFEANNLDKNKNRLEESGFLLIDNADFNKHHVSVKKYKAGE